ncbi:DUF3862 domain-containing protein [Aeribacillus composti]|uniref:DUF3862 domain-containing protein n=1 Tax=Aeribacillus composti TaxID=1868734 RepID=UPI00406A399B
MEKKKSVFKRWWFWVIVIIVIIGIGAVGGGEEETNTAEQASTEQQKEAETQPKKTEEKPEPQPEETEPENKPTISKAEFDAIKTGMTYEEVVKIIGSEGEVRSETGEAGSEFHTIMYSWDGEGVGANATLMFQGGKLQSKAQFGLD